jgi:hypothetical protein
MNVSGCVWGVGAFWGHESDVGAEGPKQDGRRIVQGRQKDQGDERDRAEPEYDA